MPAFHSQLRRIRLLLRAGRLAAAVLCAAGLAALLWLGFGLLDAAAAFEPATRTAITAALAAAVVLPGLTLFVRAIRVPATQAAARADDSLGDPRRPVSAALSFDPSAAPSPLAELLTRRSLESSTTALSSVPGTSLLPWKTLCIACLALAAPLLAFAVLRLATPDAFDTVARRLLHPRSDIPPYSPLVFTLEPAEPTVVYGGGLPLAVEIHGGDLKHPVECLVRQSGDGQTLRLPTFRESTTRHSRTLDGLTEAIDVAFACGRARSHWLPVEILLEPKILGGTVNLTPPPHTGLDLSRFELDTTEIAALEGSSLRLELTSNRPLASGSLVFTPTPLPGNESQPATIAAEITGTHTAAFEWTAARSGRITTTLRDLRGTPTPQPLDLAFRTIPDLPPNVTLSSPPRQLLATPKSIIRIEGDAEDDFALSRLQFIRTLSGFRDRVRVVAPALHDKTHHFADALDLDALGLEAGQTIELLLEASDHNPSLLGHAGSEISRIRIISEDQYAEYIRAKTTIEQFAARFQAARDAMDKAREALENLKQAREDGDADEAQKALEQARAAHREAAELMEKIAGDFPAFELEKRLKELAEKQAEQLRQNLADLENPDDADIERLLERLQRNQNEAGQLDADVAFNQQAAELLEMAARFRRIHDAQASLAKRFGTIVEEFRHGRMQNRRLLPSLAETQEKNRKALDDFKRELRKRAEAADAPALAPLVDSALQFLQALETAEPESLMDAAAAHGKAGEGIEAFNQAELARQLLERLMSEPEPFPQAAMGRAPKFEVPRPDVNANIEQMLQAMLGRAAGQGNQPRQGGAGGKGGGFGPTGAANSGFSMQVPVVGPDRMNFQPLASGSSAGGKGGQSAASAPLPESAETSSLPGSASRGADAPAISPESIPEPYRDAVKRYFTP